MIDLSEQDFDETCRTGAVRARIAAIEDERRRAVRRFWLFLAGSLLLAAAVLFSLIHYGGLVAGLILAPLVLVFGIIFAVRPLTALKEELKLPALEALAARAGLEYLPDGFDPPVFPDASRFLFGGISSYSFTDLFHGTDSNGKRFAVYEGTLTRRQGKNSQTVFTGQLYAFQRASRGGGQTAIVPDKGIFNFSKPSGVERVKLDGDPDFEKRFEVYATHSAGALRLLGTNARRALLDLRRSGKVFAYVGPKDVLVAVWGKNRFEPGSMFRSRPGEERIRQMFDDVRASLAVTGALKSALDEGPAT